MKNSALDENPSLGKYVLAGFRDELLAMALMLRREWVGAVLLVAVATLLVVMVKPLPPTHIRIAKGQPNSGLEVMAKRFRAELQSYGVSLDFVDSDGALDSLRLVGEGRADIAFSQSGLPSPGGVLYLGSVAYQPMWVIHRGPASTDGDIASFLVGKRLSIGIPGSGSRFMSELLLQLLDEDMRSRIRTVPLNNAQTLAGLREGTLDAAVLVASYDSGNTQALLQDPMLQPFDFSMTAGLANQLRFAEPVVLPAGSVRYFPATPQRDIHMIAPTMTLVARQDLHPATQSLLLATSQSLFRREPDVFGRIAGFPAFVDRSLPRSPVAQRFYERGGPARYGSLPYWMSEFVDSIWVAAVALLAIVYPLLRVMPSYRRLTFDALVSRRYGALRQIDARLVSGASEDTLRECRQDLALLRDRTRRLWVPNGCSSAHGALLAAVLQAESRLRERLAGGG